MAKFRKKPVVVEAVRVTAADFNAALLPSPKAFDSSPFSEIPQWLADANAKGDLRPHSRGSTDYAQWDIMTLEGVMTAQPGDWIVKGVKGELYPVRSDIFAETYEPAE